MHAQFTQKYTDLCVYLYDLLANVLYMRYDMMMKYFFVCEEKFVLQNTKRFR